MSHAKHLVIFPVPKQFLIHIPEVLQHRDKDFQLFAKGFLSRNARQRRGLNEHQAFPSMATYEAKSASICNYKSLFVMICHIRTCQGDHMETTTRLFSNFRKMQLMFAYTTKIFCFPLHSALRLLAPLLTARLKHSSCEMQHDIHTHQKAVKEREPGE